MPDRGHVGREREQPVPPRRLFEQLQPFKELLADDIRNRDPVDVAA